MNCMIPLTLLLVSSLTLQGNKRINQEVESHDIIADKTTYIVSRPYEETINTFEARITVDDDKNNTEPIGVIFGNYYNSAYGYDGSVDYLIDKDGHFRLYYNRIATYQAEVDHTFTGYDFRTGKEEHLALVRDKANEKFLFYVNGMLIEEYQAKSSDAVNLMRYQIGCDWENWVKNIDGLYERYPFHGKISQVTLFSDNRTGTEVENDKTKTKFNSDEDNLLASYALGDWSKNEIKDDSSNHYDLTMGNYEYYYDLKENDDFDYSILCIPDIQITTRYNPTKLAKDFEWICDNKSQKNIQYVSFVGDLTDTCDVNSETDTQWETVVKNFSKLDENDVSYGFVPGNHDYDDGVGRSRPATKMNHYLPYDKYSQKEYFGGAYYKGDILNYYNVKRICGVDYLFLNLEFGPRDSVLKWANRVCESYPDHRIVVSTHSYIEPNGEICQNYSPYAPNKYGIGGGNTSNDGQEMFDKFIKRQPNVFMVFSGHNSSDDIIYRTDKGLYGNTIHSFLIDAQGSFFTAACDVLAMFKINEYKKEASVYWYSPNENKYLNRQNQFVFSFADKSNPTVGASRQEIVYHNVLKGVLISAVALPVVVTITALCIKKRKGTKHEKTY